MQEKAIQANLLVVWFRLWKQSLQCFTYARNIPTAQKIKSPKEGVPRSHSGIPKKVSNGTSVALKKDRAERMISSSRLFRLLLPLGDTFGNHGQRRQKFSWLLCRAVVGGVSESQEVSTYSTVATPGSQPKFRGANCRYCIATIMGPNKGIY
jgi:hypothetical protein